MKNGTQSQEHADRPLNCPLNSGVQRGIRLALSTQASPFWSVGFRPFFLLGVVVSIFQMILWGLTLNGGFGSSLGLTAYFSPVLWHAHEMLFGFTAAVAAGFVLTASQNWSGKPGVSGFKLQLLFLLWLVPRILLLCFQEPSILLSAIDLAFYPTLAWSLWPYLSMPDLKEERILIGYFLAFFVANTCIHSSLFHFDLGLSVPSANTLSGIGLRLAIGTTLCMMSFMGGRVIPFFTESNRSPNQPKSRAWVETLSHLSCWFFTLTYMFFPTHWIHLVASIIAAVAHTVRLAGWQVKRIVRAPLIWVLHTAYLWMVLGFFLSAITLLSSSSAIATGAATSKPFLHAFTIGAISTLILGMITRVSLGHTGRKLIPSRWTVATYYMIQFCTVFRALGPWLWPSMSQSLYMISIALWITIFGIFVIQHISILINPRAS